MNDNDIDAWMHEFAAIEDRDHVLPDPQVIWLKARVLQSAKAIERASRPITTAQIGAYAIIAACWAALLTWKWAALQAWLNSLTPSHFLLGAAGAQSASLSLSFIVSCVVLGSVTVMLAMHTVLAEE